MIDLNWKKLSFLDRFWNRVDKQNCWVWKGHAVAGYGSLKFNGNRVGAHVASWFIHHGKFPNKGILVCHKCDNRICVNPEHLFLGTPKDNMQDMKRKNRCNPPIGERQTRRKLNSADVIEIKASSLSQRKLADLYGVSQSTISLIKIGKNWKHLWE